MRDDGPFPVEDPQPMSPRTREELERRIERLETFVYTHWAEAVPSSPATSEMDMSDSSGERHNNEASSPRKGVLTDPYIPPTSKSAIKDGVWYTQQGGKTVTISRAKKRKLQKRYGSILRALRAVEEGAVRPSQFAQTPERMWREAEGLRAFLQMPHVTPPRICEQFSDEPAPKANVFCRLAVPPKQDPQPSRRRPSPEPERRRDPQLARPKPSPEPEKRRDQQPSRHRPPPEPERRKTPPTGPRRKLFTTPDPESKREPSQPSRQRERQNPEANIRREPPPPHQPRARSTPEPETRMVPRVSALQRLKKEDNDKALLATDKQPAKDHQPSTKSVWRPRQPEAQEPPIAAQAPSSPNLAQQMAQGFRENSEDDEAHSEPRT
uniref:serine/arginine repetitive matrix protein 1-like n=1 Tax=Fragaria vesca subsp. vesca TaxID=101020 RepID=UPI0005CAD276|nr:PREDICTED: serine/arginine repetitive matrix protein 1-like [Fragaria vesca subsp. vesca]